MAAAAVSTGSFNIKTQAAYPIRLGDSLSKSADAQRFAGVRYNYKPQTKSSKASETRISNPNGVGELELHLKDDDGAYEYSGRDSRDEETFVLMIKGQGKEQEMVLERVDHCYGFDVTKTPTESNAAKLSKRYPPLPSADGYGDEDGLFGDEDEEQPLDDDNPFDYRHFLKAELEKLENNKASNNGNASSAGTPLARAQAPPKPTPTKQNKRAESKKNPASTKRKSVATSERPNPKRVKAGTEPQAQPETTKLKPKPPPPSATGPVPSVRIDRRASTRHAGSADEHSGRGNNDDSSSDELILENEDDSTTRRGGAASAAAAAAARKPTSAMGMALSGRLGPISLRSAASSPGSRIGEEEEEEEEEEGASPLPPRTSGAQHQHHQEEEYTFDLGDSSPEASEGGNEEGDEGGDEGGGEEEAEEEGDDDGDVPGFDSQAAKDTFRTRNYEFNLHI